MIAGTREDKSGEALAEQQGLLLRFVTDVQHRDVGADDALPARSALGIGPDEPLVGDPEVETVAVDLHDVGQGEGQLADVVGVSHRGRSTLVPADAVSP